jgi:hypothetical protein
MDSGAAEGDVLHRLRERIRLRADLNRKISA